MLIGQTTQTARTAGGSWPRPGGVGWWDAVTLATYLCLAAWVVAGLLGPGHRTSATLPQDQAWFEWLLAHGAYSVQHWSNPLFSLRQNVPEGVNLLANTSVLGLSIPLAPVTLVFGPPVAYEVMLIAGLAGTAAATYWVLSRHLVSSRPVAAAAGLLAGFAPGAVHHAGGQPNFTVHFVLPFIVWSVARLLRSQHLVRDGAVLGLLVAYQYFVNPEVLLATVGACLVGFGTYALLRRDRGLLARLVRGGLVGAGVAAVLLAYPLWFQLAGPRAHAGRILYADWGEDLTAYVTFSRFSLATHTAGADSPIAETEQNSYFGWPLFAAAVLAAVLLWRQGSLVARAVAVTGVVFGLFSLGRQIHVFGTPTGIPGPWALAGFDTPVVEMVMPSRFAIVVTGVVVILLALLGDELVAARHRLGPSGSLGTSAALTMMGVAVFSVLPVSLPTQVYPPPPTFITSGDWRGYVPPGRTLVPVPLPDRDVGLATFRWSAATGQELALPAGYFLGTGPDGEVTDGAALRPTKVVLGTAAHTGQVPPITDELRRQVRADLAYWRASVVVLPAQPHQRVLADFLDAVLGPGVDLDDVRIWPVGPA